MSKNQKESIWNLPNSLSLLRIFLIPVFVVLMIQKEIRAAFAVFLLASFTDVLDGFAARLCRLRTKIGALLDPAADKLLILASFIILSLPALNFPHVIPIWLTLMVIGRDVLIVSGAFVAHKRHGVDRFPPSIWGKACTVLEVTVVLAVLFLNTRQMPFAYIHWLYYLTFAFTVFSAIHYSIAGFRMVFPPERTGSS